MSKELVVVPFDDKTEKRLEGDSSWSPGIFFPYVEGMTVADVREKALLTLRDHFEETDDSEEFAAEYGVDCSGGWVIEKRLLDVVNSGEVEGGCDSSLYAAVYALKSQVAANAEFVIK